MLCSRCGVPLFPSRRVVPSGSCVFTPCRFQVLDGLHSRLRVVWEWSRSAYPRLHVSACGLLRGLFLESPEAVAKSLQADALQTGVPRPHALTLGLEHEAIVFYCVCCLPPQALLWHLRHSVLLAAPGSDSPTVHYRARTASRDMVALFCAKCPDATGVLSRTFPAGLVQKLFTADAEAVAAPEAPTEKGKGKKAAVQVPPTPSRNGRIPSCLNELDKEMLLQVAAGEMDVCLGGATELWWSASCCARPREAHHRGIAEQRVKVGVGSGFFWGGGSCGLALYSCARSFTHPARVVRR